MLMPLTAAPLSHVNGLLRDLPRDLTAVSAAHNLALIAALGRNALIVLDAILGDNDLLHEVAGRSYRHINHFDKIVIVDSAEPDGYRLTLHLWRPPYHDDELDDELIHDHRFNFWSTVLTGTLVSENFRDAAEGSHYRRYRYVPELQRSRSFEDFYEFAGNTRLFKFGTSVRDAGQSYQLMAESIHRVVLPEVRTTCSLVLRGPRLRSFSTVFNTTYPTANTRMSNRMFSPSELCERLTHLRDALIAER